MSRHKLAAQKARCTAYSKWGTSHTKYPCDQLATHWHPELGELCRECAITARLDGAKGIVRLDKKPPGASDGLPLHPQPGRGSTLPKEQCEKVIREVQQFIADRPKQDILELAHKISSELERVKQQRDELLAACNRLCDLCDRNEIMIPTHELSAIGAAQDAIANAEANQ